MDVALSKKLDDEALHPETRHGAQGRRGSGDGETVSKTDNLSFSEDTARHTGQSTRNVQRDVALSKKLDGEAMYPETKHGGDRKSEGRSSSQNAHLKSFAEDTGQAMKRHIWPVYPGCRGNEREHMIALIEIPHQRPARLHWYDGRNGNTDWEQLCPIGHITRNRIASPSADDDRVRPGEEEGAAT
jgi:hypothetical protein